MIPERTVKVGFLPYRVDEVSGLVGNEGICGQHHGATGVIRIDADLPELIKQVTLWHELMHGVFMQAGQQHDEQIIEAVAHGVVQLLTDNPWLRLTGTTDS